MRSPIRQRLDGGLVRPMAWLSVAYLVLLAGALPQLPEELAPLYLPDWVVRLCFGLTVLIWPLFIAEALLRVTWLERGAAGRSRVLQVFVACVLPPLRMGLPPMSRPGQVWLPLIGWAEVGRPMARRVETLMSGPMMVVAILILPALALEFVFRRHVEASPLLQIGLDISLRVIWLAFAVELTMMLSASRAKLDYARRHWIDVAIVVFPLIAFLRALRLLRLGRIVEATKLAGVARTFRLRAVALRLVRALLLLRVLERLSLSVAERRLAGLRGTIERRQRELTELRQEAAELERDIAQRKAAGHAKAPAGATGADAVVGPPTLRT